MTAKVEAPKMERLRTKERNPSKDFITSVVLALLGAFASEGSAKTGGLVMESSWWAAILRVHRMELSRVKGSTSEEYTEYVSSTRFARSLGEWEKEQKEKMSSNATTQLTYRLDYVTLLSR